MITGINTDVEYQGKIYHVQTEDIGKGDPTIVSILFISGAILYKRKTSYSDKVNDPNLPALLKDMMGKQHRDMLREVMTGKIFQEIGEGAQKKPAVPSTPASPPASSPQKAAPKPVAKAPLSSAKATDDKSLDDMILDYLNARGEGKNPGG
ncbi:MAG TPA: hypothetical protein VIU33_08220 [Nitrospiria bacterium]